MAETGGLPVEKDDPILEHAIDYRINRCYPPGVTKDKKRAVRKRAAALVVENGEVFLQRKNRKVCAVPMFNIICLY